MELVVEAASQKAVKEYIKQIISAGKELVVMSVGALLDPELKKFYKKHANRIHIPSGAIAGLDAVKALKLIGIEKIELITTKKPSTLTYASYIKEKGLYLENIKKPMTVFEGTAAEAVKAFPRSLNVAAILELYSDSPVHVKLIADPKTNKNTHQIRI